MVTKIIQLDEIKAANYNPRRDLKPSDEEYQNLKQSIENFGFVEPLIINERTMTIVGGHQRYKILRDIGETQTEAIIVNLTEDDEKILNIALNKIEGDWDFEKLGILFSEFDIGELPVTGFSKEEILSILPDSTDFEELKNDYSDFETEEKNDMEESEKISPVSVEPETEIFKIYISFKNEDTALDWLKSHGFSDDFSKGGTITLQMNAKETEENAVD